MTDQRSILVSGASTGIGRETASLLSRRGFRVFAGVRTDEDAQRLAREDPHLHPLFLDVTDAASIERALQAVRRDGTPLYGLLNNAGIAVGGPLEYVTAGDLRKQFEVNVIGTMALTQAAIPLLRESRGRIVTVGSISSRFGAPFVGPYCASKAALAMLVDSLRLELAPFGIVAILFEFAAVKTPIWQKGRALKDELAHRLPQRALDEYAPFIEATVRQIDKEERDGLSPSVVAAAIAQAFTTDKPRARYVVGRQARMQATVGILPHAARDAVVRKVLRIP